jgi:hypothetical protein
MLALSLRCGPFPWPSTTSRPDARETRSSPGTHPFKACRTLQGLPSRFSASPWVSRKMAQNVSPAGSGNTGGRAARSFLVMPSVLDSDPERARAVLYSRQLMPEESIRGTLALL